QRAVVGGVPQSWRLDPDQTYGTPTPPISIASFPPWDGTPGIILPSPLIPWVRGSSPTDPDPNHDVRPMIVPIKATNGATQSGTTVTITIDPTFNKGHGLNTGDPVVVAGVGVPGYNGTWVITSVPTPSSFTFTTTAGLGASGGGTASSAS